MKENRTLYISILISYIGILSIILLYVLFLKNYLIIPACPIYSNFGFYCPACGCTRAVLSLINLDVKKSLIFNPIIIYTFLTTSLYLIFEIIPTKRFKIRWKIFVYIGLIILFLTCIFHNTILPIN